MSNAIIGFMQLVLDRLRLSCHNLDTNDFELPGIDDLDTFDMDTYLSEKTKNQVSWNSFKERKLSIELFFFGAIHFI